MIAPGFWWSEKPTLGARLLQPIGAAYGAATLRRMRQPGERVAAKVICVGNLSVGGSGKTPVALFLAGLLTARGKRVAFLTRGYGGRLKGPVLVDLSRHSALDVGDEPLLLAALAPTIVSADRLAGAKLAIAGGADVIVMDDGFQNPALVKDLSLVVVDAASGFGNGLVVPAGPLRAPIAGQIPFAQGVIAIGEGSAARRIADTIGAIPGASPVILARLAPAPAIAARLKGQDVIAMAGIGLPAKFLATLKDSGARIVDTHLVGDHKRYGAAELQEIAARAQSCGALVATTEKDVARIGAGMPEALRAMLLVVPVALELTEGADILDRLIERALS
jgi:tetraacyldisaccharide 4'-kinase